MTTDARSKGKWPWSERKVLVLANTGWQNLPPWVEYELVREIHPGTRRPGDTVLKVDGYIGNLPPSIRNEVWVRPPSMQGVYLVRILGGS